MARKGKVAFVTGGRGGIALPHSRSLARERASWWQGVSERLGATRRKSGRETSWVLARPKALAWCRAEDSHDAHCYFPTKLIRYRLLAFLAVLGPGFITADVDNDPGGDDIGFDHGQPVQLSFPIRMRFRPAIQVVRIQDTGR